MKAYKGNIIFSKELGKLKIFEDSYLVVEDGKVVEVVEDKEKLNNIEIIDYTGKIIIPGFVDIHVHAPQINNRGLGVDMELLDWLNHYTFPEEAKYKDLVFSEKSYKRFVNMLWENGTTSSVIFGSIYKDSNILLAKLLEESGLKAYVGKVNMDRNSPDFYIEKTENSLIDTEDFIKEMNKFNNVKPIITPRFIPSCTEELMYGLGDLAAKYDLKIQSHLSENQGEIMWVKELHPDCENYVDVYIKYNLIRKDKTVMAHCVLSNDEETKKIKEYNITVAHAPVSNSNLSSGIAPIYKFLKEEINVGLCTDISGGHEINMTKVITSGESLGKFKWIEDGRNYNRLGTSDYFYMATKGSGRYFGNVGTFEKGYDADFLVIDDENLLDMKERTVEERFKRYIYIGDHKNIIKRYVLGRELKKPFDI